MRLPCGTLIDDRYEVISCLGEGGMSVVYEAIQKDLGRTVAIKVLSPTTADFDRDRARLQREALALSSLKNKAIVQFYGFGYWNGSPYIVMEYVIGKSLQDVLRDGKPLSVERSLNIAKQICQALVAAHAAGVIHRDLKPSNVMLVEHEGTELVKIIDFGLAFLSPTFGRDHQKLTEAGMALGSILYMSPEQCRGEPVDVRTDIYSLGAVIHHCLTGQPPFMASDAIGVMFLQLNEFPPTLQEVVPEGSWPAGLQQVIFRCMDKSPEERYASAGELISDLERVQSGLIKERPISLSRPERRRHSWGAGLLYLSAFVGIGAVLCFLWVFRPQHQAAFPGAEITSARALYTRAREPNLSRAEQTALLERALIMNKKDASLVGFALTDAESILFDNYLEDGQRAKAQESGYQLLRTHWFASVPPYLRMRLYELYGQAFQKYPHASALNGPDFDRRQQFVYEHIRMVLKKSAHDGGEDLDRPSLFRQLARLSNTKEQLDALCAEATSEIVDPLGRGNLLAFFARRYFDFGDNESIKRARVLCRESERILTNVDGFSQSGASCLLETYSKLNEPESLYRCAMAIRSNRFISSESAAETIVYGAIALEMMGRREEQIALVHQLEPIYANMSLMGKNGLRTVLCTYMAVLESHHRFKEIEQLRKTIFK